MVMPQELEKLLIPIEGGEKTEELRGTFRPSPLIPIEESLRREETMLDHKAGELDQAFAVVKSYLDRGHTFTNFQTDLGARLVMAKLPPNKVNWIREIAERIHKRPLWQCFAGWFAFADENGMAQAPIFDSVWENRIEFNPDETTCMNCNKPFIPAHLGQSYCSNKCGGEVDKKRIAEKLAKQSHPQPIA